MTRSTINPENIWLRKTEMIDDRLYLILKVRSNIKQVEVKGINEETHTEYEYDETEISYPVPDGVTTIAELKNLISVEAVGINQKATREKAWKEIHAGPIEGLRKTVVKL